MDLTSQIFWSIVLPLFNEVAGGILGDWTDFLVFLISHQQNEGSIAVMETLLTDALQMIETKILELQKESGNFCDVMKLPAEQEDKLEVLAKDLKHFKGFLSSMKHPEIKYACSSAKEWSHAYIDLLIDICDVYESGSDRYKFEKLSQKHFSDFEKRDFDEDSVALYKIATFLLKRNKKEVLQKFPELHDENFLRTGKLNEVRKARIFFARCADRILDHELSKKFNEATVNPPCDETSWAQYLFNIFSCIDLESNEVDREILKRLRYGLEVFAKEKNSQAKEEQNKHIEKWLVFTKRSFDAKNRISPTPLSTNNTVFIALIQMNFHHSQDLETDKDALISSDCVRSVLNSMKKLGLGEYETFWYFLETIKKTSLEDNVAEDILEILNIWKRISFKNENLFNSIENEMKVKMSRSIKRSKTEEIEKKKEDCKRRREENEMRKLEKKGSQKRRRTEKGMGLQRRLPSSRRAMQENQEQVHEDHEQVQEDQNQFHPEMNMDRRIASSLVTITDERAKLIMGLVMVSRPRIEALMKGFSDFPHPIRVMEKEKAFQALNDRHDEATCRNVVKKLVDAVAQVEQDEYDRDTTDVPSDDQETDKNQGMTSESGNDLIGSENDDKTACRAVVQELVEEISDRDQMEQKETREEEILKDERSDEGSAPQEALNKRPVPNNDQESDDPKSGDDQNEYENDDLSDDGIEIE